MNQEEIFSGVGCKVEKGVIGEENEKDWFWGEKEMEGEGFYARRLIIGFFVLKRRLGI